MHGKFGRTEDDKNGTWGCWYVPLRKLYEAFKDSEDVDLKTIIDEYDAGATEAREQAWERIVEGADDTFEVYDDE